MTITSDDPVRQVMNRGLLYIIVGLMTAACEGVVFSESVFVRALSFALMLLFATCAIPTRRGQTYGAWALIVLVSIGITIGFEPATYIGPPPAVGALMLLPAALAAVTIKPRYGVPIAIANTLIYAGRAWWEGFPAPPIIAFAIIGATNLIALLIPFLVLSTLFSRTLRERVAANAALATLNADLELRVEARTADLAAANARIERRASARADEVAKVVHDLRHEITLVGIAADTLVLDAEDAGLPLDAMMPAQAQTTEALSNLTMLLDEMLDAAKLEGSALQLQPQRTDMTGLVSAAMTRIQPRYQKANCDLTFETPSPLPDAWCDRQRITRVLLNVLLNAFTYTSDYHQKGAPGIDLPAPPQVRVTLAQEGGEIVCRVADNGPGIAPDALTRLGQRFTRVASGSEAPEGSGLGLNFCFGVLALSGGSLRLESDGLGRGTIAVVRLPSAPAVSDQALNGDGRLPADVSAKGA